MMQDQFLVVFDADRIKDYVFATGRLKEIRGASERVRGLTDEADLLNMPELQKFDLTIWSGGTHEGVIYAGGGAGALLFNTEQRARDFCITLERTFRHETDSATLSAVCVPVDGDDTVAQFAAQERAARALARRKASRFQAEAIPGGGVIRFCSSDRLRPASRRVPDLDNPLGLLVSAATSTKRQYSIVNRTTFRRSATWLAFEAYLTAHGKESELGDWRTAIHPNQDLGSIAVQSRPKSYVAFVHADGDGIGTQLGQVVRDYGFRGYHEFSNALTYAATQATGQSLAATYGDSAPVEQRDPETGKPQRFLPFEVITVGGDDVILICTAERGLEIASAISEVFGSLVEQSLELQAQQAGLPPIRLKTPVSASVGVVIAHDGVPIVQLENRASDLLKNAKWRRDSYEGWLDFHIVSTPGVGSIRSVRSEQYMPSSGSEIAFLMRPYPVSQMQRLLQWARIFQKLPGSKRAQLYDACLRSTGYVDATLAVLRVQARMGRGAEVVISALRDLQIGIAYPFRDDPRSGQRVTPLIDLLEVAEFVRE